MTKRQGIERIKPGPKPIEVPLEKIADWAQVGFRWSDIAVELEVTDRTLRRYRAVNPQIDRAYEKGLARMRRSLRSKQYEIAMKGNVTMLIWLGKNELEQADKKDTRSLHIHANADSQDALSALSTEELQERIAVLREMRALEDVIDIEGDTDVPSLPGSSED